MELNAPLLAAAVASSDDQAKVNVKMADDKVIVAPRITIILKTRVGQFEADEEYFVIDLDDRWDLILGMRWLEKHQPRIDWATKTMHKMPQEAMGSPLGVMSNELTPDSNRVSQFTARDMATEPTCLLHPPDFDNDGIGGAMSSEPDDAWDVNHDLPSQ
ncbi:unnamed protein product, partial [Aphanomyces euteiches]